MSSAGQTKILAGLLVIAVAGYFFSRSGHSSEVASPANSGAGAPQGIQKHEAPAMPTPAPSSNAQVPQAAPSPLPQIPGQPEPSPEMIKKLAELNAHLPQALPKEFADQLKKQKNHAEAAFASESRAKAELKEMEKCVEQAASLNAPALPSGAQVPGGIQSQMQASCMQAAQKLVEKYPSLRAEYDAKIASKVSPETRERAQQPSAGCCGQ